MAPFVDLNVLNTTEKKRLQSIIETAARLGYSTIAINHVADLQQKRREIDKPISVKELFTSLPIVQGTSKPIKIVTRLTVIVSEAAHCNDLRTTSKHARLYDIMAVLPKTEKLFHAIDRGIYFELAYSPAIKDSTMRRYTISNALSLMQICKGKNVIMSSAAERPMELRGPYDLANLGLLLGLSEGDAKAAVSTNCRAALLHGETRKTALGVIYTMQKAQTNEDQEEGRPLCKRAKTQDD
ncbi:ribonuclease P protein subunit p30 isoform X2 [Callorhinchus milii]|uniref:ribonuclease P protein subunit p30 isoform X2 n=1 Tax=Callorhinchus milii TaxID=7868 RepID=UPI000457167F|nr:ribonuclease P protein subunit p30 isoform X2 [Callorhinchus milii]|eukprot:gi/632936442/ref/XP_007894966.1/ PREDICTED: ribonuclease P protein subunit p30 isoform X2 [Callorhinchus milii]